MKMMAEDEDQAEEEQNEDQEDAGGDAEGGDGEEDDDEGGNKIIIIAAAAVVLLIAVGAGLFFTGMLDGLLGKKPECVEVKDDDGNVIEECPEEEKQAAKDKKKGGKGGKKGEEGAGDAFLEIPPMIVNLNSEDGTPRYLRLSVQLELYDPYDSAEVQGVMPRVIDQFQTYLRELRVKDLRGSSGIYRLQTELLWRVNQAAAPVKIKDVLFQEILIQ